MRMMFFLLFLLLTFGSLFYVLWHTWQVLPLQTVWRWTAVGVMGGCFLCMFLIFGGMLDRLPLWLSSTLYQIGTSSLIALLYLFLVFLCIDVLCVVKVLPFDLFRSNGMSAGFIAGGIALLLVLGNMHHNNKVRVPLTLQTEKALKKDYRIVMLSDLHLGYHHHRGELARWVDMINDEKPDVILIAGDIIDISVRPLLEENMAEELRRLKAPVYACLGNHEYFSREEKAREFYKDAGINLLVDSCATIDGEICVIGRDDRTNRRRKSLKTLVENAPKGMYTIVMDHQPYHLEEAEKLGVDFQLSGHTHRGQVWPISWITDRVYECSWGEWQRKGTRYYISSGLGIWGGKFRIGTQSEYVVAEVRKR